MAPRREALPLDTIQNKTMKMKNITKTTMSLAAALLAGSASAATLAAGTVIGVAFGGDSDNNFNEVKATGTFSPLIDTTGATLTGVGLTFAGANIPNHGLADGDLAGQPSQFSFANLDRWSLSNTAGGMTINMTGLNDSLTYDLVIGAASDAAQDVDTIFSADGQSFTNAAKTGNGADAFVSFTGLETDGSGTLVITADMASGSAYAAISAMELTAVPEPGSLALLGLGGLMLIRRRRRD